MNLLSFAIIEHNDHYLMIRETSSKWKGQWYFPGGHAEKNEDAVAAVIRETKEEAGCDIKLEGIFHFHLYRNFFSDALHLYYHGKTLNPHQELSTFAPGAKWFSYQDLLDLKLRQDALKVIEIYRALNTSLPLYNFNQIRKR